MTDAELDMWTDIVNNRIVMARAPRDEFDYEGEM